MQSDSPPPSWYEPPDDAHDPYYSDRDPRDCYMCFARPGRNHASWCDEEELTRDQDAA
jgi:hypothetical protein